jgi:hypothetical protein
LTVRDAALLEELETLADLLDESTQQERGVLERAEAAEKHAAQLQIQLLALQVCIFLYRAPRKQGEMSTPYFYTTLYCTCMTSPGLNMELNSMQLSG